MEWHFSEFWGERSFCKEATPESAEIVYALKDCHGAWTNVACSLIGIDGKRQNNLDCPRCQEVALSLLYKAAECPY